MNTAKQSQITYSESEIIRLLTDRSSDDSWVNRQLGAQLTATQGLHSLDRYLLRLLTDPVDWVRFHSLQGLIDLQVSPIRLLPVAERLLNDSFFRVRQLAATFFQQCLVEALGHVSDGSGHK